MRSTIRILFLAADPFRDGTRLELDGEMRALDLALRQGRARDVLELVSEWAPRIHDLQDALLRHAPQVVHFVGHGNARGGIWLADEHGRPRQMGKEALRGLFGIARSSVRVVVLSRCDTPGTMEALSEVVDYTVGVDRRIGERPALVFAEAFYAALAMGRTVLTAFELGMSGLDMEGDSEAGTPVRRIRRGVNLDATLVPAPDGGEERAAARRRTRPRS